MCVCVCVCVSVCLCVHKSLLFAAVLQASSGLLQLDGLMTQFSTHSGEADLRWEDTTHELLKELQQTEDQLSQQAQQVGVAGVGTEIREVKEGCGGSGGQKVSTPPSTSPAHMLDACFPGSNIE